MYNDIKQKALHNYELEATSLPKLSYYTCKLCSYNYTSVGSQDLGGGK